MSENELENWAGKSNTTTPEEQEENKMLLVKWTIYSEHGWKNLVTVIKTSENPKESKIKVIELLYKFADEKLIDVPSCIKDDMAQDKNLLSAIRVVQTGLANLLVQRLEKYLAAPDEQKE